MAFSSHAADGVSLGKAVYSSTVTGNRKVRIYEYNAQRVEW